MFTICSHLHKIERLTCAWLPLFFYPVLGKDRVFCCLVGDRISSKVSAAASSADCIAWVYMFPVVDTLECPSRFDTVFNGVPLAIRSVAFVV